MPPKKPKDEWSTLPVLTPPKMEDEAFRRWYRVASDIAQVQGPYIEDEEEKKEPEEPVRVRPVRAKWGSQMEFLMSCIATSVGLGNVWRFAFVAYQNGGGAFLVPYIIVLFVVGKPMYYLECLLGQFSSRNSLRVWSLAPGMRGTGYAQALGVACVLSYYMALVAICMYYLIVSCQATLPWSMCRPEWENCVPSDPSQPAPELTNPNGSATSAELYFIKKVLQQIDGIDDGLGAPIWYLAGLLLLGWSIVFMIVARGVHSTGKAAYFLALFPYVVMIILLITTVILPGASKGILFFITPDWKRITDLNVWYAAVTQVFFSLSVGSGAIIMFSSYNCFTSNVHRDSLIVTTLDTLTSLLSGFTIFGILGNLAYNLNAEIEDVVGSGGTGLAFISYPDAIAKTVEPHVYSILFFIMMSVLGVGSAVAYLSTINAVLLDWFPHVRTIYVSAATCFSGFLLGVVYTTPGGQYILELVDYYGGTFLVLFCAISEIVGIAWVYGLENICLDIEFMLGRKTSMYWRVCWGIVTPCLMIFVFLFALMNFQAVIFGGYYRYPDLAYISGYCLLFIGMLCVPALMCKTFYQKRTGKFSDTIKKSFIPKETWGPRDPKDRTRWKKFKTEAKRRQEEMATSKIKHIWYSLTGGYRKGVQQYETEVAPKKVEETQQSTIK